MKVTQVARERHICGIRKDQKGMFVGFNYQNNPEYEVFDEVVYNRIIDAYGSDEDIEPIFKEFDHKTIIGIKESPPFQPLGEYNEKYDDELVKQPDGNFKYEPKNKI